MFNVILLSYP